MTIAEFHSFDTVVVGAGCAGLWTAHALARLGAGVLLLEAGPTVGGGPSTRNAGHVHGGAVHAAAAADDASARRIAERCRRGFERLRAYCGQAFVPDALPFTVLVRDPNLAERAASRWADAAVFHRRLGASQVAARHPNLAANDVALAAEVADQALDSRLLYAALLADLRRMGADVRLATRVEGVAGDECRVAGPMGRYTVRARQIIHCTGTETVRPRGVGWPEISLWKSHVLVAPRLPDAGFLFLDAGGVSMTAQLGYSLVCCTQEDRRVAYADYRVDPTSAAALRETLCALLPPLVSHRDAIRAHGCLKPSLGPGRSVASTVLRLSPHEILALPGKATVAPIMADEVAHLVFASRTVPGVADRPGDATTPGELGGGDAEPGPAPAAVVDPRRRGLEAQA